MRNLLTILISLILIAQVTALPENYNDRTSLTISYTSSGQVNLEGSRGFDHLDIDLFLFPKDTQRQKVISLNTNPDSEILDESIRFTYDEFKPTLEYSLSSQVKTQNQLYPISPSPFPILDLPQEYQKYLDEEEIIDITPEIISKASEIVEGETDLYAAVFKIADWVNTNIEYDLNTLTANAALKSSWVLENKGGVCDEITSLFISMLRSVGIPARFVSGTAYSNLNYSFVNHGWAEVYFPDQGWVPYDITFTEFGWIDPGHLTLSKSLDAGQTSVRYTWKSSNTDLVSSSFSNNANVIDEGTEIDEPFDISINALIDKAGPGSYIPIEVIVENPYDKYLSDTITITKAPELLEENQKPILLKPDQKKSTFWILRIPLDVSPRYIYTSEIEAKDLFGKTAKTAIEFASSYDIITLSEAENIISELEEKQEKSYSEKLTLNCNPEKEYYYDFENITIICNVKNIGNTLLEGVNICLNNDCITKNLQIGINEEIRFENIAKQNKTVATAKINGIELMQEIPIKIFSEPDVKIMALNYKKQLNYNEPFNISFMIYSIAKIDNIEIKIGSLEPIYLNSQDIENKITINTNSKYFSSNKVHIKLSYEDEYGRKYTKERDATIQVLNTPWYAKILSFFSLLFN